MNHRKVWVLSLAAGLMVIAIWLLVLGSRRPAENSFNGNVADLVACPAGWKAIARPIAETPEMQQAVGEILNYDDACFVDYISPSGERLSLYIAYWKAGKMPSRAIAGHTPDVCWVSNGWEIVEATQIDRWGVPPAEIPLAESRVFKTNNATENVLFWHLVGGEVVSYGAGRGVPWHAVFSDAWQHGLNQRKEQFFVRLSSDQDLSKAKLEPLMTLVFKATELLTHQKVASNNLNRI